MQLFAVQKSATLSHVKQTEPYTSPYYHISTYAAIKILQRISGNS